MASFNYATEILDFLYNPQPNNYPQGLSTGKLLLGIGTTALGALSATKQGVLVPHVIIPILPNR